jgi:topoisomerase-4 subunit A
MIDLDEQHAPLTMLVHQPGRRLLVASAGGYGFIVEEDEVVASTRKGKQVLNISAGDEAAHILPANGNRAATVGTNRKLLVFNADEINELTRGKGVILQRLKNAELADVKFYDAEKGLTWIDSAGRTFTLSEDQLAEWHGQRAQAGKPVPKGFPRSLKFGPHF